MLRNKKVPKELLILVGIFLFLLVFGLTGLFGSVRELAEKAVIIPVKEKIFTWQRSLKKDLGGCQLAGEKETAELKTKIAVLTEENLAQKRLLSAPLPKDWRFEAVKVIGLDGEILLIAAGKNGGVAEGMIALTENTYLGKVFEVSEEASKIRLPSFFEQKEAVKIASGESVVGKGLLVGLGQGRMKVEQIFSSETVQKDNLVTVDVAGGSLLVGKVEEVIQAKGEAFKTAQVRRLYNPEELNTIFLIRGRL